ncbi:hypothetical protein DL771_005130 [Monosporascus sp. 5C6A]|nr:hypothetical protein DL771_005130 [Monosporascus sp. 5C6A]
MNGQHQQKLFRRWRKGSSVEVAIGSGSGQVQSPFSAGLEEFVKECVDANFNAQFFSKLSGKVSMFEHHLMLDQKAETASSLELAMANYENDSFFLLLRLDFKQKRARALIFLKLQDSLRRKRFAPLSLDQFISYLGRNSPPLGAAPFLVANTVLSFFQHESFRYVEWRQELYDMESRLGVTRNADILKESGYATISFDYDNLNADLAWFARKTAETTLSASTTMDHAKGLLRLAELCEFYQSDDFSQRDRPPKTSQMREEIHSTIQRAELFLKNMKMVDDILQSMRAVLYNRISKHDSDSMKTIAVVTLFFLPATFVSSIFATDIFDFHATEGEQRQTISRYGWIYLLLCILLTCVSLILWLCWYRWGSLWLEKLQLTRAHLDRRERPRDARHTSRPTSGSTINNKGKDIEEGKSPPSAERAESGQKDLGRLVEMIEAIARRS